MAFIVGLGFALALPIYKTLVAEGFFEAVSDTYLDFVTSLNLKVLFENISVLSSGLINIISNNITSLILSLVLFSIFVIILGALLINFYQMPTSSVLNMYMNSNVKQSFMGNFFGTIKRNLGYSALYLVTLLPINFGIFALTIFSLKLFKLKGVLLIFSPFFIIVGFTLLQSLKMTLFCGWVPAMVTQNQNPARALKSNFVVSKRRFLQTFGNAFAVIITLIFINVFGGLCTFGVALLITIPASFLITNIFGMVAFYMSIGQRFYVDPYNVIAPKTIALTEKIHNQKYIV